MVTLTLVPDTGKKLKKRANNIDKKYIQEEHKDLSIHDLLQSAFAVSQNEKIVNCAVILIEENGDYIYNWSNRNMPSSMLGSLQRMQEEFTTGKDK